MNKKLELTRRNKRMLKGLEKAYEKFVAFKHYKNSPLLVESDGKIREIALEKL